MFKLVNINPRFYSEKAKKLLKENFDYIEVFSKNDLNKEIDDAHFILIRIEKFKLTSGILKRAKKLIAIGTNTTGLDHIDQNYCNRMDIKVFNLYSKRNKLNKISASSEYTWGLIMSLVRKIPYGNSNFLRKIERINFMGHQLSNKTIGIIGMGRNGKNIYRYAKAFKMNILTWDKYKKNYNNNESDLKKLLRLSDIVTIHIPLNEENKFFFDKSKFNLMKKNSYFINTSRGNIVDEKYLFISLKKKLIAGAAIDVMGTFFSKKNNLLKLSEYMKKNTNLIITPHIAGVTRESWALSEEIITNVIIKFKNKIKIV